MYCLYFFINKNEYVINKKIHFFKKPFIDSNPLEVL